MRSGTVRFVSVLMVTLLGSRLLPACTEASDPTLFALATCPDDLQAFARGNLGILQPQYARSYLYVTYRYLIGRGFDDKEQAALVRFWQARLGGSGSATSFVDTGQLWQLAVDRIRPLVAPPDWTERSRRASGAHAWYFNCGDDAFRSAAAVLNEKAARLGESSPVVREWLEAQLGVFNNCSEGRTIPPPARPDATPADRADRDYQIAAARFYAGDLEEAERLFRIIAEDRASPWRTMGRYLAARCLVRRGTLSPEPDKRWDFGPLYKAQKELTEILADPELVEAHHAARSLLHFVRFRTEPEDRLAELSKRLLENGFSETLFRDLWDYVLLLDRLIDCERFTYPCGGRRLVYDRSQDDLTDWIETVQAGKQGATDHAVARWREGGGTPWLLAALMKTAHTDPWRDEVLEAAGRIGSDSPAFPAASYHRVRLLLQSGSSETARELLASLEPSRRDEWSRSTKNHFAVFAVSVAKNFMEFLRAAIRVPAAVGDRPQRPMSTTGVFFGQIREYESWPALFTPSGEAVLDGRTPISRLLATAAREELPEHLRLDLALVSWTRSVLVDEFATAERAAKLVAALDSQWSQTMNGFLSAGNVSDRRFEATLVLMSHPEITPDVGNGGLEHGESWVWYPEEGQQGADRLSALNGSTNPGFPYPAIFTDSESLVARREQAAIVAIGSGPNFFCREAVRRARTNPKDPRVPETLYRAIQSTRHFGASPQTSQWSRRAFTTLHRQYPESSWAKKAKYWY